MIDLHAHVLPGVDDGAKTLLDSVTMLKELSLLGVTTVYATPHFVEGTKYTSSVEVNQARLKELAVALEEAGVPVKVRLGNEVYLSRNTLELVESGKVMTLGGSEYLLVELPMSGWFDGCDEVMLELLQAGYKVVLAHPERYESIQKHFPLAEEFFRMGVRFQCNMGSFAGEYGAKARKVVKKLASRGMIYGLGSDIHRPAQSGVVGDGLREFEKNVSVNIT